MIQAKYCTLEHAFFGVVEKSRTLRMLFLGKWKNCARAARTFFWMGFIPQLVAPKSISVFGIDQLIISYRKVATFTESKTDFRMCNNYQENCRQMFSAHAQIYLLMSIDSC